MARDPKLARAYSISEKRIRKMYKTPNNRQIEHRHTLNIIGQVAKNVEKTKAVHKPDTLPVTLVSSKKFPITGSTFLRVSASTTSEAYERGTV